MSVALKLFSVHSCLTLARTPEEAGWAVRSALVWPRMSPAAVIAVMGECSNVDGGGPPGGGYICYTYGRICITFWPRSRVMAVRP